MRKEEENARKVDWIRGKVEEGGGVKVRRWRRMNALGGMKRRRGRTHAKGRTWGRRGRRFSKVARCNGDALLKREMKPQPQNSSSFLKKESGGGVRRVHSRKGNRVDDTASRCREGKKRQAKQWPGGKKESGGRILLVLIGEREGMRGRFYQDRGTATKKYAWGENSLNTRGPLS